MLRYCAVALAAFLLSVAPVMAQTPAPTLPPESPSSLVRDLSDAAERFGIMTVITFAVIALLIILAWRVAAPLLGTIKDLNDERGKLQAELFRRLELGDKERAKTAEVNERTVGILDRLETKQDAQQGRENAVEIINQHADKAHEETRKRLQPIEEKVDRVIEMLLKETQKREAGDKTLNLTLESATRVLMELRDTVQSLKAAASAVDTPADVPDADPATPS